MTEIPVAFKKTLSREEWSKRRDRHLARISALVDEYLDKRSRQAKNPVMDFLFEYYAFRPSHLKKWSPGFGVFLEELAPDDLPEIKEFVFTPDGGYLDPGKFPFDRTDSIEWICKLLKKSAGSKPHFGCFGMHEWAMVYKSEEIRHNRVPLRMKPKALAWFVESRPLVCTHYDAFRFFTEEARPMNKKELSRCNFHQNEQPGCIHTNMDLYKWAFKMYPWIGSELIREAFEMALEARIIDMKASPYDLSKWGLKPIKIETEEGRTEYLEKQNEIFEKARPIREKLTDKYEDLFSVATLHDPKT